MALKVISPFKGVAISMIELKLFSGILTRCILYNRTQANTPFLLTVGKVKIQRFKVRSDICTARDQHHFTIQLGIFKLQSV